MVDQLMRISNKNKEWLDAFCKVHYLNSRGDALDKLIECYKAWNEQLFAKKEKGEVKG